VIFREAVHGDLRAIVALLADDVLGKARDIAVADDVYKQALIVRSPGRRGRTLPPDVAVSGPRSQSSIAW
jgi:hypothetical protein